MRPDNFIEFLERHCREELAKITETKGVWSYEGGLKDAYTDINQFIKVFKEQFNDRPEQAA